MKKAISSPFFWLFILTLLAFGLTIFMYFWRDDFMMLYKLQNIQEDVGHIGKGPIGDGLYKFLVTPYIPFYPVFGLNPMGYFVIGLLLKFISGVSFYYFIKRLTRNTGISFWGSALFITTYISSEGIYRIINSWQNSIGLTLVLITLTALLKSLQEKNVRYYLWGILLYIISTQIVYVRAHSEIFLVLALEFIFRKNVKTFLLRLTPFLIIFKILYLDHPAEGSPYFTQILGDIFKGNYFYFIDFFQNLGNAIVPDPFQILSKQTTVLILLCVVLTILLVARKFRIPKAKTSLLLVLIVFLYFLNKSQTQLNFVKARYIGEVIAGLIGLLTLPIFILGTIVTKDSKLKKNLTFGFVALLSQIIGYTINSPSVLFVSNFRYFAFATIGLSIFIPLLAFVLVKGKEAFVFTMILIVGTNIVLNLVKEREFIENVSVPTREFFAQLRKEVPQVKRGSVFYFDHEIKSIYGRRFYEFFAVGSMRGESALADFYGLNVNDIRISEDFAELPTLIKGKSLDNFYAFYYGEKGLINTSDQIRSDLKH